MRLDSANRSFLTLMGLALLLGMYVLCGAIGSILVPLVVARVSHDGLSGLWHSGGSLLPVVLFIALVAVGLAFGARSTVRQIVASRRLARRVRGLALELPGELAFTARGVGLGGRVVLLDAPERFSFAYGLLTPRVVVSCGPCIKDVLDEELRAILEARALPRHPTSTR